MADYDLAIVGGGPSGSTCATFAAKAGLKVLLLEKERFPREKVCGDCLNPSCWPVLERLGVAGQLLAQPHAKLRELEMVGVTGASRRFSLQTGPGGEVAIKRSLLDQSLLENARSAGADVQEGAVLRGLRHENGAWHLRFENRSATARLLVGADGRNSTVARLRGIAPVIRRDRVAIQTHWPCRPHFRQRIVMRLFETGYCGIADVGDHQLNLCLVSTPARMPGLKQKIQAQFAIPPEHPWRTITPLARKPAPALSSKLLLVGDAARVVEPFTGEGIYYALASGELAARSILSGNLEGYPHAQQRLYRGRLWVNQIAKAAVLHPKIASKLLAIVPEEWLKLLSRKILGPALASP